MLKTRTLSLVAGLLVLTSVSLAQADDPKGAIQLHMSVEKEVVVMNADGQPETRLVAADKVFPRDKVVYTIRYENTGKDEAEDVYITNPIPEHMGYVDGTASGEHTVVTFSVDGGKTFDAPQNLKVPGANGELRQATAQDYTHIRWMLEDDVPAQATGAVSFRAELE